MGNFLKSLGAIFLMVGTAIGGGMLALPLATAHAGFWVSLSYLLTYWLIMTTAAFFILELTLQFKPNTDLITLAKSTFGLLGQIIAWIAYLGLLYTLIAAYLSAGGDLTHHGFNLISASISHKFCILIFLIIMGTIVTLGFKSVDRVNRVIMTLKMLALILLLIIILPISGKLHPMRPLNTLFHNTMVIITAFGFAIVVPSIRSAFSDHKNPNNSHKIKKQLRWILLIGSCVPLICYILWEVAIFKLIPLHGPNGLLNLSHSQTPISSLLHALNSHLHSNYLENITTLFTSLCILTAFLGVGISLMHFLSDGLSKIQNNTHKHISTILLAFLPPLVTVLFIPSLFIYGLKAAGLFCVILLILLPAFMTLKYSYQNKYSIQNKSILWGAVLIMTAFSFIALFSLVF